MQHQRRIDLGPLARLESAFDGEIASEIEVDAAVLDDRSQRRTAVALEQQGRRELGDSLRDERLRGGHEHQRLLQQPAPAHE